jgi:Mor family transcriptional regulator
MLNVDRTALVYDRLAGMSLTQVAKKYSLSRASVVRFVREAHQSDSAGLRQFLPEMLRVEACAA